MSFFQKDYTPSAGGNGNYTKLQPGENRLRILSDQALQGWQYWNTASKPVRSAYHQRPVNPADLREGDSVKECLWTGVYNYATKAIEIWEITQKGILNALFAYASHEDYGDPIGYGLTVTKSGSGMETKYSVVAGVPKPLPVEIQKLADETPLNLRALLDGGSPFDAAPTAAPAPMKVAPKAAAKKPEPVAAGEMDDNDLPF